MELQSLEIKIARSENLPVLPQIVSQVLKIADDPNASPKSLEKIIEHDAAICAKILRVANSPYYGLSGCASVARAISVLGMNQIRSLVVGIAYQQMISGRQHSASFSKMEFWQHSLATATAAKILGKLKLPQRAEEMYGAAMMHDVGLLVLDRFCSDQLDQAIRYANETGMQLFEAERMLFDYDHAQAGALLADKWQIDGMLRDAIAHHHDLESESDFEQTTFFVHAANAFAHACAYSNSTRPQTTPEVPASVLERLGMPAEQVPVILNVIQAEVTKAQDAFQIPDQRAA